MSIGATIDLGGDVIQSSENIYRFIWPALGRILEVRQRRLELDHLLDRIDCEVRRVLFNRDRLETCVRQLLNVSISNQRAVVQVAPTSASMLGYCDPASDIISAAWAHA